MNILLTGGAGYIGTHLSKLMHSNKEYNVIIYDNLSEGSSYLNKYFKIYKGDLNETNKLKLIFEKYNFITVIHLAGFAHISDSFDDPQLYYKNNLVNSINLLDICINFKIKNFIFSSSCTVYGDRLLKINEDHIFNEKDNLEPISPYGNSKMCFEYILKDYAKKYGFNYSILRYFNACGSDPSYEVGEYHKDEKRIIPRLINSCINNKTVYIYGNKHNTPDGTCIRDYTHVCDVALSHIKALNYMIKHNKSITCNIGSGKGYSIKELITKINKISGKEIKYEIINARNGDASRMICTNENAKKILLWEPQYTIDEILSTSYEWYKNKLPLIIDKLSFQSYFAINEKNQLGDVYSGEVKENMYHGKGKLIFSDGGIFEGEFENNEFIKGKHTLDHGEVLNI